MCPNEGQTATAMFLQIAMRSPATRHGPDNEKENLRAFFAFICGYCSRAFPRFAPRWLPGAARPRYVRRTLRRTEKSEGWSIFGDETLPFGTTVVRTHGPDPFARDFAVLLDFARRNRASRFAIVLMKRQAAPDAARWQFGHCSSVAQSGDRAEMHTLTASLAHHPGVGFFWAARNTYLTRRKTYVPRHRR